LLTPQLVMCCFTFTFGGGISSADIDEYVARSRVNRVACAPLSVWYCLRRLGRDARLEDVTDRAQLADDGVSAPRLVELCQSFGLRPRAIAGPRDALAELPVPSILIIDDRHCVVYDGMAGETTAHVFEPVTRRAGAERTEWLREHWTGEAIVFAELRPSVARLFSAALLAAGATMAGAWLAVLAFNRRARRPRAPDV